MVDDGSSDDSWWLNAVKYDGDYMVNSNYLWWLMVDQWSIAVGYQWSITIMLLVEW